MGEKVKLSEDGSSIDFVQSDSLPASMKKFRQSPEIEGFYRFVFENDLQNEAFEILDVIVERRKAARGASKASAAAAKKAAKAAAAPVKAAAPAKASAAKAAPAKAAKPAPKKGKSK
jgi:hypothetical protein